MKKLTIRLPADASKATLSLTQSCMSRSENPSEITVTREKCAHALPEMSDAAAHIAG